MQKCCVFVVFFCSDLVRLDPSNMDAVFVRGLCLYYQENIDKAFSHFQQVLRLAPDHSKALAVYKVRSAFGRWLKPDVHLLHASLSCPQKAKQLIQKKEEGNVAFRYRNLSTRCWKCDTLTWFALNSISYADQGSTRTLTSCIRRRSRSTRTTSSPTPSCTTTELQSAARCGWGILQWWQCWNS